MGLTANLKLQTIESSDYFSPDKLTSNFQSLDGLGKDYVVEQGTKSESGGATWFYRKWKSGIAECWGTKYFYATTNQGMIQCGITYPFTFAAEPIPNVSVGVDERNDSYVSYVNTHGSTTTLDAYIYKPTNANLGFHATYAIKGRWK